MAGRILTESERQDILRRFNRGDTLGLIAFAYSCDKKLVSRVIREAGLDPVSKKRTRERNVEWAWRGAK